MNKKNKILWILAVVVFALFILIMYLHIRPDTAEKEEVTQSQEDYIILPDYSSYTLSSQMSQYSEADIIDYLDANVTDKIIVSDRAAQSGDIVNIDYNIHDEFSDDENVTDYEFCIGNYTMIEEFENSIIGMLPEETKTFTALYPEGTEHEGETMYITVTLNGIYQATSYETVTDKEVAVITDNEYSSKKALFDGTKKKLESGTEEDYFLDVTDEIWNYFQNNIHITGVPDDLLEENKAVYENYMDYLAKKQGETDYRTYLAQNNKTTDYEYNEKVRENAYSLTVRQLIFKAFAEKEGLDVTDAEISSKANELYTDMEFSSAEEMLDTLGTDVCKMYILQDKIADWFIAKNDLQEDSVETSETVEISETEETMETSETVETTEPTETGEAMETNNTTSESITMEE